MTHSVHIQTSASAVWGQAWSTSLEHLPPAAAAVPEAGVALREEPGPYSHLAWPAGLARCRYAEFSVIQREGNNEVQGKESKCPGHQPHPREVRVMQGVTKVGVLS